MSRSGIADADIDAVDRLYAPGSADGSVPDALAPSFDWWRERAVKPLALPPNA